MRWEFLKEKTWGVHFVLLFKNSSEFGLLFCLKEWWGWDENGVNLQNE